MLSEARVPGTGLKKQVSFIFSYFFFYFFSFCNSTYLWKFSILTTSGVKERQWRKLCDLAPDRRKTADKTRLKVLMCRSAMKAFPWLGWNRITRFRRGTKTLSWATLSRLRADSLSEKRVVTARKPGSWVSISTRTGFNELHDLSFTCGKNNKDFFMTNIYLNFFNIDFFKAASSSLPV